MQILHLNHRRLSCGNHRYPRVRPIQLHSRTAVLQPLNIFRGCGVTSEKGDRSVTTSEAQRLRSIARELEAEADLTDPAAMEWGRRHTHASQRQPSLQSLTRRRTNLASDP